jgi:membrane-bound acyltransferase YfiQ involved in biofilm formation
MLAFIILLIILCIYETNFISGKDNYNLQPLKMGNALPLRGILAVEIVLGHVYGYTEGNKLLYLNDRIAIWVVGMFFFLSGYGLMISFHKKENYLKKFLLKRIGIIIIPFLIMKLINFGLGLSNDFIGSLLNDWFTIEIIVVYIVWYVSYKFMSEKHAFVILAVLVFVLNVLGCYYNIGTRWYGSTACFLAGIMWEHLERRLVSYFTSRYVKSLIGAGGLILIGGILFIKLGEDNIALGALLINITCILICCIIYILLMKFTIGNIVTNFLGTISWEIYVSHRTFLMLFDKVKFPNYFIYMISLYGSIILTSWILYKICSIGRNYGKN